MGSPFARFGVHLPPRQKFPVVQSVSTAQPPAHTLPEQRAPAQSTVPGAGHVAELPVHVDASFAMQSPVGGQEQLGPLHCAPALPAACWHVVEEPLQRSVVQGFPSSAQVAPALPAGCVHAPPLQMSAVQGFASALQAVPSGFAGVEQVPSAGLQVPAVWHSSMAGQDFGALLTHAPPEHVSVVHALPSVQVPELFAGCWQAVDEPSHWSNVHGLPSSAHAAPAFPAG